MKLTVADIHELVVGLTMIDQDPSVKLAGATRLKLAINLNALRPIAAAYEAARAKTYAECVETYKTDAQRPALEGVFAFENQCLRLVEHDVSLSKVTADELNLDENVKITANTLSRLVPIIQG